MKKQKGFYHEVTEEQIKQHQKRSVEEILQWLHSANVFLNLIQTKEEKARMKALRKM